jgi:hypothetical protein
MTSNFISFLKYKITKAILSKEKKMYMTLSKLLLECKGFIYTGVLYASAYSTLICIKCMNFMHFMSNA